MGKKEKPNKKDKKTLHKGKDIPVKKKLLTDKLAEDISTLKIKQKGLKQQWKAQRHEHSILAKQHRGTEIQTANLLKHIPSLRLESQELRSSLKGEIENAKKGRNRLDNLESRHLADHEQLGSLIQQMAQQVRLLDATGNKLLAMEQLASQSAQHEQQIEQLRAGNSGLESHIGTLVTQLAELKHDNTSFGSSIERLYTELDEVTKGLQQSIGQHQQIENSIGDLNRAGSDVSLQVEQQHKEIHGLADQAENFDRKARNNEDSLQTLIERLRDLMDKQASTEDRLVDKDGELEKKTQRLDREHKQLAVKHTGLTRNVLVIGILLLTVGGIVYWTKFRPVEQQSIAFSQQMEQISAQLMLQERSLTDQENDGRVLVAEEWDARYAQINRNQGAMETNLLVLSQAQNNISTKLTQLEEDKNGLDDRLKQTDKLISGLVNRQTEAQTGATQQEERLPPTKNPQQGQQAQEKAAITAAAIISPRNSSWLQGLNPKHYTVQIMAAYDAALVSRVAARKDLHKTMAIYKGKFKQKDWNILLYGVFSTVREAKAAIRQLPGDIRANNPWVRKLSSVHRDLAKK